MLKRYIDIKKIIRTIETVSNGIDVIIREKPYGIVHESAFVDIEGQKGRIVWDYIIWNELTFEVTETGKKLSLLSGRSDAETKEKFDELVSKYGV